jgi:hypothetical protein
MDLVRHAAAYRPAKQLLLPASDQFRVSSGMGTLGILEACNCRFNHLNNGDKHYFNGVAAAFQPHRLCGLECCAAEHDHVTITFTFMILAAA